jgi:hypothetical protein
MVYSFPKKGAFAAEGNPQRGGKLPDNTGGSFLKAQSSKPKNTRAARPRIPKSPGLRAVYHRPSQTQSSVAITDGSSQSQLRDSRGISPRFLWSIHRICSITRLVFEQVRAKRSAFCCLLTEVIRKSGLIPRSSVAAQIKQRLQKFGY